MKPLLDWTILLSAAIACTAQPRGVIEGRVTIGPLSGPVPPGRAPDVDMAAVYAARKIAAFTADGKTEVARSAIADGKFRIELPPGTYVVKLVSQSEMDNAKDLPKTVTVDSGAAATLDIEVDTGIR